MDRSVDAERLKRILSSVKHDNVTKRVVSNSNALALMLASSAQSTRNTNLDRLAKLVFVSSLVKSGGKYIQRVTDWTNGHSISRTTSSSSVTVVDVRKVRKSTTLQELLGKYTELETYVLDSLESIISLLDNFYFLSRILRLKNSGVFRMANKIIVQTSKIYMAIILLTMKNLAIRYWRVDRIEKQMQLELRQIRGLNGGNTLGLTRESEMRLIKIQAEKIQIVLEILGNLNEMAFCFIEIFDLEVPNFVNNVLGLFSWIMSLYRMSKEEADNEVDDIMKEYEKD